MHLIQGAAVVFDLAHDEPHPLIEQRVQARGIEARAERVEVSNAGREYRHRLALDEGQGERRVSGTPGERPVAPTHQRSESWQARAGRGDRVEPRLLLRR